MQITEIFHDSVKKWFSDKGDAYMRIDYPELNSNSLIFDIGGYMGTFTESIYTRYGSNVYLFEPVDQFYKVCDFKFCHIHKITTFNFGLSSIDGSFPIYLAGDASSTSSIEGSLPENVEFKNIVSFIEKMEIDSIDLMKINIEGDEYNLLEKLIINPEVLKKIKNLQIQYHTFIPNAEARRNEINNILKNTHECNWSYDWVWENWKLKNIF